MFLDQFFSILDESVPNHMIPLLFSLGQHDALVAVQARLWEGECIFAFLDDIDRVSAIYAFLQEELWQHARIRPKQRICRRLQ